MSRTELLTRNEAKTANAPVDADGVPTEVQFVDKNALIAAMKPRLNRMLTPWYVTGGVAMVAAAAEDGGAHPGMVAALTPVIAASAWWRSKKRILKHAGDDPDPEVIGRRRRLVGYCAGIAGAWSTLAVSVGVDMSDFESQVTMGALLPLTLLMAKSWWQFWSFRTRPAATDVAVPAPAAPVLEAEAVPGPPAWVVEVVDKWNKRMATARGALPGTELKKIGEIKGGWWAEIASPPGDFDPDRFRTAIGRIAAAFQTDVMNISVEVKPGDASKAILRIQHENPLWEVRLWPGMADTFFLDDDLLSAISVFGRFGDEAPAMYRWWNAGGPWHDLISGATGSGKSETVNQLIIAGLHSNGLIIDRVCDPQKGQSYGVLQDYVDWFASSVNEMRFLLLDTVREMYRRNRVLSRRRQKTWRACREMPLIVVTIDEAHEVLKDPLCLALVEKLAKMARKCGIKLRFITQVPLVTELGNSTPIKDAILGGNVIVHRTGSPLSGQFAFNGALPVQPHLLLPEWPEGTPQAGKTTAGIAYMIGTSRRAAPLRAFWTGEKLEPWLFDIDGDLTISPGVPSPEQIAASGDLWGLRQARIAMDAEVDVNDSDILPGDLAVELMEMASILGGGGRVAKPITAAPTKTGDEKDENEARDVVLREAVARTNTHGVVTRQDLVTGLPQMPGRTLTYAVGKLVDDKLIERVEKYIDPDTGKAVKGVYRVTDAGRTAAKSSATAEAEELAPTPDDVEPDVSVAAEATETVEADPATVELAADPERRAAAGGPIDWDDDADPDTDGYDLDEELLAEARRPSAHTDSAALDDLVLAGEPN